jgi:hypothetical protein
MKNTYKKINAIQSISKGFRLAGLNWGLNIAFFIVYIMFVSVISKIPYIGQAFNTLIAPILIFGYGIVAHLVANNKSIVFRDFFNGFDRVPPLFLTNLLTAIITGLSFIPLLWYIGSAFGGYEGFINNIQAMSDPAESQEASIAFGLAFSKLSFGLAFLLAFLSIIVSTLLMFSLFFVWYKNSEPVQALTESVQLVTQNIGQIILLMLLVFVIIIISALPFFIGLLFTIPALNYISYAAFSSAVDIENVEGNDVINHLIS